MELANLSSNPKRKTKMSLEQTACEDLKAFERRLTEVIACLQPTTSRWRVILVLVSVCTSMGAYNWLSDPETSVVSFSQSLWNHPFFTISAIILGEVCINVIKLP
uniref:Transmembrane protein 188 n=1 Tax=Cuerna arida TaxID=1464854 RepID=A0A1B6GLG6_9HEMI